MRTHLIMSAAFAAALGFALPASAAAYPGEELASQAKIKIDAARAIALKAHAGTILSEELEKEKGGSGLRYTFDIRDGKTTREVGVDAATGKVLENITETPAQEAAEKAAETHPAH